MLNEKRKMTQAHKDKLSASNLGKKHKPFERTKEHRIHSSEAQKGKPRKKHTQETKDKMAASHKGHTVSIETAAKISKAKREKPHIYTEEQKESMSLAQIRFNANLTQVQRTEMHMSWQEAGKNSSPRMSKDTKHELAVTAYLLSHNIEFVHPFLVYPYETDFYVPSTNTIIEVNGCYWHQCEVCGYFKENKRKEKDMMRLDYIRKQGYNVKVIWGHDIKNGDLSLITQS